MPTLGDLLADLAEMFPHNRVTPATIAGYMRRLSDIPPQLVEQAIERLIDTSDRFPTLKAIREAAAEIVLALPSEDEALSQVERSMAWARAEESKRGDPPGVHPKVKQALAHVGGYYAFRSADEPSVVRGQFLRLYRELRAAEILSAQVRTAELRSGRAAPPIGPVS